MFYVDKRHKGFSNISLKVKDANIEDDKMIIKILGSAGNANKTK